MKYLITLLLLLLSLSLYGQSVIYSENCGTPTATTLVGSYTGWQQNGRQIYTGNADVRTTVPSTGYIGASASGNIFITNTLNTNCTISGINTIGYTGVCLQFGILKTTNGSNGSQLAVEYSTDGSNWTTLSFTMGTGSGSSNVWTYIQPTCTCTDLPATSNLRIRFRMASLMTGLQFRVDDIKVMGSPIVLPIIITNFTVSNKGTVNTLRWTSLSESTKLFVIEKSTDLKTWEKLAETVDNVYIEKDINDLTYYRLYVEEYNYYSPIVAILLHNKKEVYYYNLNGRLIKGPLEPNTFYIRVEDGIATKIYLTD